MRCLAIIVEHLSEQPGFRDSPGTELLIVEIVAAFLAENSGQIDLRTKRL